MAGDRAHILLRELADLRQEQVDPARHGDQLFRHYSIPAFDAGQRPVVEFGSEIGSHKFIVPPHAVLLSKLNPRIPRVWLASTGGDGMAIASTEFLVLVPRERVDKRFLKYVCLSPGVRLELEARASGTSGSHQRVRPADALSISVEVPSDRSEQHAIANILGSLDDKIELNQRMGETLEAMARAFFQSWFVDFDPVRAKVDGRDPGLPQPIADLFPARLSDSEIGAIPEGWDVLALPKVILVNPTRTLRKGIMAPYLEMAHMPAAGHVPVDVVSREVGSGARFVNGDTLVARITPCLENGKTAYVDFLADGQVGWGSTEYIVLRPVEPLPSEYAYCLARSTEFRQFAIQSMTGSSGRQRVPADALQHFRVAVPPRPIAEAFGRYVKPLLKRASEAARESRVLAEIRDKLLPKLMSGELRVRNLEYF